LVTQLPASVAIEAGSASYQWLLIHAADDGSVTQPTVGGLPLNEQRDLPSDLISLTDADGRSLTTIDVTHVEGVGN
jgi:hypothetical protein